MSKSIDRVDSALAELVRFSLRALASNRPDVYGTFWEKKPKVGQRREPLQELPATPHPYHR